MTNVLYSGPTSYNYYTLTAGLGLSYDGVEKYAYLYETPVKIWIESADGSKSANEQVITGDKIVVKASIPVTHFLTTSEDYAPYIVWAVADLGDKDYWQIYYDANQSGTPVTVGSTFAFWAPNGWVLGLYEKGSSYLSIAPYDQNLALPFTIASA